jgi:prepilin-type N-terminal cleavage/methylation domain-containing protein
MRERGFSMSELLVVAAIVAIAAAVTVPFLAPARSTAEHEAALDQLVTDLRKRSQQAATTNRVVDYVPARDLIRTDAIRINDYKGAMPESASLAREITFEAATGRPSVDGKPGPLAVTLTGDDGRVTAAVVSPLGSVSAWVRSGGEWRAR